MTTSRHSGDPTLVRTVIQRPRARFWRVETIGQKLTLGFLIILVLLAASGAVAYFELATVGRDAIAMEDASTQAMSASHLQRLSETSLIPVHDFILTGDPAAKDRFNKTAAELDAMLAQMSGKTDAAPMSGMAGTDMTAQSEPTVLSPEQMGLLANINDLWTNVRAGTQSVLDLPDPVGNQKATAQLEKLEASAQSMSAFAESIHVAEMESVRRTRESANATIVNTSLFLVVVVIAAFVLGALLSRLISRSINRPMAQLTQMSTDISLGELDKRVEVSAKGEIGELAAAIERMRTSLKMTIDRLAEEEVDLRTWTAQLADRELKRKVRGGLITLGGQKYEVGKELDGQFVYVKLDYDLREIVVTPPMGEPKHLPLRA